MCPKCHSAEVSRSHSWRVRDLVMKLWGMKPVRCQQCRSRFYLPSQAYKRIDADRNWLREVQQEKPARRQHRSEQ